MGWGEASTPTQDVLADRWRQAWIDAVCELERIRTEIDAGRLDLDGRRFLVMEVVAP